MAKEMNIIAELPGFELKTINIADIIIKDRKREDYGDLRPLAQSIKEVGLLNPLTIADVGGELRLAAGGRRTQALLMLGATEVEARVKVGEIAEHELTMIELHENLYRKDFTYEEELAAKLKVHTLMQSIHGEAKKDGTGWGYADTGRVFGETGVNTSRDVKLAAQIERMGEGGKTLLQGCATKSDAQKRLNSIKKAAEQTVAVQKFKETASDDAVVKRLTNSYKLMEYNEDLPLHDQGFFLGVRDVQDSSVDFIECDPPYGIDLVQQKKNAAANTAVYKEVPGDVYTTFSNRLIKEMYRVLKQNRFAILWFGESVLTSERTIPCPTTKTQHTIETVIRRSTLLTRQAIAAGFTVANVQGIWAKTPFNGQSQSPKYVLANAYEQFLILRKGSPELAKPGANNLFIAAPVASQHKIHPTERPLALIKDILNVYCRPNDFIMSPFAGSGTTMLAAEECKMFSVGWDLTKDYYNKYLLRVAQRYAG